MKKITKLCILTILVFTLSQLYAQTSSRTGTSSDSSSRTTTGSTTDFGRSITTDDDTSRVAADFLTAIIGGMLRHPNPDIRKQALQSITSGFMDDDTTTTTSSSSSDSTSNVTENLGAIFLPDIMIMLSSDPDPEVRDIASVGFDMIYGTNITLERFMEDPDPIVRKYAMQVFARKNLLSKDSDSGSSNERSSQERKDLIALRTLLVRLKYEEDPEIQKMIQDSLEWFVKKDSTKDSSRDSEGLQSMFGTSSSMLRYIDDPDPEIRKEAIQTIGQRDSLDSTIEKLLERLRVEEDESVKDAIRSAIRTIRDKQTGARETRGYGGPGGF